MQKKWLALGLLAAAVVLVIGALWSGKPDQSPQDPRSAEAIQQPDKTPPPAETTPQSTAPR